MKQDRRGFTLIEVLVAVMVLSVGVMALVGLGRRRHPDDRARADGHARRAVGPGRLE